MHGAARCCNSEFKIPRFRWCTGTSIVSSCWLDFTDVRNSIIYFFCFLAIDNDIMRKRCTLITSKGTNMDENIANQNHATRTRTPKPGYLKLPIDV